MSGIYNSSLEKNNLDLGELLEMIYELPENGSAVITYDSTTKTLQINSLGVDQASLTNEEIESNPPESEE